MNIYVELHRFLKNAWLLRNRGQAQYSTMLPKLLLPPLISALLHGTSAKLIWSTSPANTSDVIRTALPVGNGRLAAMPIGPPSAETLTLNLDSLWSGGPFEASVSLILHA